jgi:hypothetical protein
MTWADAVPSAGIRWLARICPDPPPKRVAEITGLHVEQWDALTRVFPLLGKNAGLRAARARRTFALLARHALARTKPEPRWDPAAPSPDPALYLTIHIGNLRILRYFLRASGIPAATIVDETHIDSARWKIPNDAIDRRFPHDFPHTLFSAEPHRLRSALRGGSLIAPVDRVHPPPPGAPDRAFPIPFLGGTLEIDPAPLRLARIAGVPARGIFVTAPKERLTITVGKDLPGDPAQAAVQFGNLLDDVARSSPADFDGYTHRFLAAGF